MNNAVCITDDDAECFLFSCPFLICYNYHCQILNILYTFHSPPSRTAYQKPTCWSFFFISNYPSPIIKAVKNTITIHNHHNNHYDQRIITKSSHFLYLLRASHIVDIGTSRTTTTAFFTHRKRVTSVGGTGTYWARIDNDKEIKTMDQKISEDHDASSCCKFVVETCWKKTKTGE